MSAKGRSLHLSMSSQSVKAREGGGENREDNEGVGLV